MNHVTAYPLTWPEGWKRTKNPVRSRFGDWKKPVTIAKATTFVLDELRKMGIPDFSIILSSNLRLRNDGLPYSSQRTPDDIGISVWWNDGGKQMVIALDQYDRIADNLWAVGKTIEALRGIERWGGGEILQRTFTGFAALPHIQERNWRDVLGVDGADREEITVKYKKLRSFFHPDKGGNKDAFNEIQNAYDQARRELGF